ncbi:MAG: insulinase family protein, partial [Myxococcota bacterium]|nr:insulinase family protein [Myxococcota bacterium]
MTLALLAAVLPACWWTANPGPAAFDVAAAPVAPVGVVASGPITYVQVTIAAGTAREPAGQQGVAWLTAHLLRQGGAGERSPAEVDALLDELGTDIEVIVDRELVTLRARALHEDTAVLGELLVDMLLRPQLDPDAFGRIRDGQVDHLERGVLSSDEELGLTVLETWAFEGHPYGSPLRGRSGALPSLGLDDVRRFLADRYVRSAVTLGMAGPAVRADGRIDAGQPGGAGLVALRDALSSLPPRLSEGTTPRRLPAISGRDLLVVEKPTGSTGIHFGHTLDLDRNHADWPALVLAFTALGEHRQSHGRLYRALRGERGLNYGDYAYVEVHRQAGWSATRETGTARRQNLFHVWLRPTTPANGPFALKAAVGMVEAFVSDGLSPEEFVRTRDYLRGRVALWADHPGRRLGWAVEASALGMPDPVAALPDALEQLRL